ncbi:unnamed protein product, partial [Callosobruchus maculatus]
YKNCNSFFLTICWPNQGMKVSFRNFRSRATI